MCFWERLKLQLDHVLNLGLVSRAFSTTEAILGPWFSFLFKLHFIDYAVTVVPIFPPLPSSTQHPPLPQAISPPLFMSKHHSCKFFGYSISCTVLYIPMATL